MDDVAIEGHSASGPSTPRWVVLDGAVANARVTTADHLKERRVAGLPRDWGETGVRQWVTGGRCLAGGEGQFWVQPVSSIGVTEMAAYGATLSPERVPANDRNPPN